MTNTIVVKDLSISIKDRVLLNKCSFSFDGGDIVLLEGKNGIGKSTLLKAFLGMNDPGVEASGEIYVGDSNNVLKMKDSENLALRSKIAYLEQKDLFDSYYGITVRGVLEDSLEAYRNAKLSASDKRYIEDVFNAYVPSTASFTLKSKVNKLSGGQQRIVSILASLCIRKDAGIFLIDEPLNNLDINSIVLISNMLNKIQIGRPEILMIIISHCKIFPFVNTTATIIHGEIKVSKSNIVCHSCFGECDEDGFY